MKHVPAGTLEKDVKYIQTSCPFTIDFEHISDLFLVFPLFTMNRQIFVRILFFVCKYY